MKNLIVNFIYKNNKRPIAIVECRDEYEDFYYSIQALFDFLDTPYKIKEMKRLVFIHNKTYDDNEFHISVLNDTITINLVGDCINIPKKLFKEIINDWEMFLKNKKNRRGFTKEYFI